MNHDERRDSILPGGQLFTVDVTETPWGDTVVTLTSSREAIDAIGINLAETDRLSLQAIGGQITAGLTRLAAARRGPDAPAIGTCFDCGQSIFDDESWVGVPVFGDVPAMSHLECATAGD